MPETNDTCGKLKTFIIKKKKSKLKQLLRLFVS